MQQIVSCNDLVGLQFNVSSDIYGGLQGEKKLKGAPPWN
jgi:hypothetical protein